MPTFESVHSGAVLGRLVMFDRLLFKGYLPLWSGAAFERFLHSQHVLLKDFKQYVAASTATLKARIEEIADKAGRPVQYLATAMTANRGQSKEEFVRGIAERDGITEGLIAVLSTLEPNASFDVRWDKSSKRLAAVRRQRRWLHYYLCWPRT